MTEQQLKDLAKTVGQLLGISTEESARRLAGVLSEVVANTERAEERNKRKLQ